MRPEDAEEYTQALGQVVAGGWRQIALGRRLGVPKALGLSVEEWVENRLGGYVRLSVEERREAVAELTEEGMSTRDIGETLGVNNATVNRDQHAVADATPESEEPEPTPEPEPEPVADATPIPGQTTVDEQLADLAAGNPEPSPAEQRLIEEAQADARYASKRALNLLATAAKATASLNVELKGVATAAEADDLERHRDRAQRALATWQRLVEQLEPQPLRRVK